VRDDLPAIQADTSMTDTVRERERAAAHAVPAGVHLAPARARWLDWRRLLCMSAGLALFCLVYFWPPLADAVDPQGQPFQLTYAGQAALALFLLAAIWWIFEVVPIGVTSIAIGVAQVLLQIRPAKVVTAAAASGAHPGGTVTGVVSEILSPAAVVFGDFMAPPIWFILGAITFGMVFSKTGLTRRVAYGLLVLVGERTSVIYLGTFALTAGLTLIMAHTAVAATVFPLLMAIYALYAEDERPTRFGKGLFIGMAFVAGAGSIMTFLGSARAAVAAGFLLGFVGHDVSFLSLTYYLLPFGCAMVLLLWVLCLVMFPPEKKTIPGLRARAQALYQKLGPITTKEIVALLVVGAAVLVMALSSFLPALKPLNKSAVIVTGTILFFVFNILTIKDLEEIPWNTILLFGGAMSIGACLWQTGAARWLGVTLLTLVQPAPWLVFVLGTAVLVLVMSNFIMNVAAIALVLPVALVMARYLGVSAEVIFFSCLVTAGMPFLLLVGAAPNAIAYESRQFSARTFFLAGIPASVLVMLMLALFVLWVWPLMGMPIRVR
jgi:sodium-dependent dicarboxylate transporter 2/3/5